MGEGLWEDVKAQIIEVAGDMLCPGLEVGRCAVGLRDVRDHRECSFLPRSQVVTAKLHLLDNNFRLYLKLH